jgi:hypothetical protein
MASEKEMQSTAAFFT